MNKQKRLANSPPDDRNGKRIDQTSTPETQGATGGFDSSSLPLGNLAQSTASTSTNATAISKVSARLLMPKKTLDKNLLEGVPGHYFGARRDVIEVEIVSIDGEPYTTNMRSSDAIRDIFIGSLKFSKNDLIGVQVAWKGRPHITFRTKTRTNIDMLPQLFSYVKKITLDDGSVKTSTIKCMLKGVRPKSVDDGTRTVTFEKCGWKITHAQIEQWASYYGQPLSKVREVTDDDIDPDVQPDDSNVGCGNLQIDVKLRKIIPQFLPMHGYKVRVYYRDIPRVCTNCYQTGHLRKMCPNETKSWIHHICDFISGDDNIAEEDFGYWMDKSRDFIRDNPEKFDVPDEMNLGELDIQDSTDQDTESDTDSPNSTFTNNNQNVSSPKVITSDPIASVSNFVDTLEAKSKANSKQSLPTGEVDKEKKSKGRQKTKEGTSDVMKRKSK